MDAAERVRLVSPDPQTQFPFAEPGAVKALAIPIEDLDMWRGRGDVIRNPGFVAVKFALRDDPRYRRLFDLAAQRRMSPECTLMTLIMTAGFALRQETPGVLARGMRPLQLASIRDHWHLPSDASDQEGFAHSIAMIVRSEFLVYADLADPDLLGRYGRVRARDRARSRAAPDRTDVDGPDGHKTSSSTAALLPVGTDGERSTTVDNGQRSTTVTDDGERSHDDGPRSTVTNDDGGLYVTPRGVAIPTRDAAAAEGIIREHMLRWRKARSMPPWPCNTWDFRDLRAATARACRDGRIPELIELLMTAAEKTKSGGGFHNLLVEWDFLEPKR